MTMYFSLRTAFAVSHRFWTVVFSFSLVSVNCLNLFLISWFIESFLSRMVLSLQVFEFLPNFSLWLSSVSERCGLRICMGQFQSFGIGWELFCVPEHGLFLRMFHGH